ncbi:MAG TPA: hypothetical protein PKH77_28625, partial [Anaerolineae bacterium]|nr:hypothetical protein [Anaerolineae bacterium]
MDALQILTTKLYIPAPHPNLVPRERLLHRLDEGLRLGHRLFLISAPAGFGKTTLLSEWIAKERGGEGETRRGGDKERGRQGEGETRREGDKESFLSLPPYPPRAPAPPPP